MFESNKECKYPNNFEQVKILVYELKLWRYYELILEVVNTIVVSRGS